MFHRKNTNLLGKDDEKKLCELVKTNAEQIYECFIKKYVVESIEKDLGSVSDAQGGQEDNGNNLRNLHRGYELILELFDRISIQDWLKIQNNFT